MISFNSLDLIVLAQLHNNPDMTGYNMTKLVTGVYSHQQVYRQCSKLHKVGFIKQEIEPQTGKPDRLKYKLANIEIIKTALRADLGKRKIYVRDTVFEVNAVLSCAGLAGEVHTMDYLIRFRDAQTEFLEMAQSRNEPLNVIYRKSLIEIANTAIESVTCD